MFIAVDIWTVGQTEKGMAVLLRIPASARCVPVYVELGEAQYILTSLSGVKDLSPGFPEFIIKLAAAVSAKPDSIGIFKDKATGKYRAVVHFSSKDSHFSLKIRTPEALAIAVRARTPIFLEEGIAQTDSIAITLTESEISSDTKLTRLQEELDQCVNDENYERAANIRDRIKQMEKRMRSSHK